MTTKIQQNTKLVLEPRQEALNRITTRLVVAIVVPLLIIGAIAYLVLPGTDQEHAFLMLMSFLVGVLGGFISVQQRLPKATLGELTALSMSWSSLIMMPVTGGVFAMLLYLMFSAQILTGPLFPAFSYPEFGDSLKVVENVRLAIFKTAPETAVDLSKILFWSFVAGFLERFVPRLLREQSTGVISVNDKIILHHLEQPRTAVDSSLNRKHSQDSSNHNLTDTDNPSTHPTASTTRKVS